MWIKYPFDVYDMDIENILKEEYVMLAIVQEVGQDTVTMITSQNYRVVVPSKMVSEGIHIGDQLYLQLQTECDEEVRFQRMIDLEKDYIARLY